MIPFRSWAPVPEIGGEAIKKGRTGDFRIPVRPLHPWKEVSDFTFFLLGCHGDSGMVPLAAGSPRGVPTMELCDATVIFGPTKMTAYPR